MSPIGQQTSNAGVCDGRQLHALLREQAEVVALLVRAATQKRDAILERDGAKIEAAVAEEVELAQRVAVLEEKRSAWIEEWASGRRLSGKEELTLSDVLSRLPKEQAAPIKETADALMESVDELHQLNRQNEDLIYYSLAHLQALLGALAAGGGESSGLYGPRSQMSESHPRTLVDWRV